MTSFTIAEREVRKHYPLVQKLAADLERIYRGSGPSQEDLQLAPIMDDWHLGVRPEPALMGRVTNHPLISGHAVTSQLYILDPEAGYARTLTRWYRLGREIGGNE